MLQAYSQGRNQAQASHDDASDLPLWRDAKRVLYERGVRTAYAPWCPACS